MLPLLTDPAPLPCPSCTRRGIVGTRIGNHRGTCRECNRFAAAVRRKFTDDLAALHPEDAEAIRRAAEIDVYTARFGPPPALTGGDGA